MRIEKRNSSEERRILIGMIVDKTVLGRINSRWKGRMFKSKWANIIAKWCLNYYGKYKKAPLHQIESLFETWSEKTKDESAIKLIEKFLSSLSDEYKELKSESNSDYIIDMAGNHFNQVQIEKLIDETQSNIDNGNVNEAHEHISSYNKIEMGVGEGIDILKDTEAIKEAFQDKEEPLIEYPGALGEFFGSTLERDAFVAFMAPEGRGKSFWLMDVAFRAMIQRRKVAYFQAGDMSQNQIMRRLMLRTSGRPLNPKEIKYPIAIKKRNDGSIRTRTKIKRYKDKLSWQVSYRACKKIMRKKVKSKSSYFKLSCHPNTTLSVKNIESILQDWEKLLWTPDVIVIDYADILNMSYYGIEGRDRINETWNQLRALSQKLHCLVVTATQSDALSYEKELMTMQNFSDDKRKAAHVTGLVGINQTPQEKLKGIFRLNFLKLRDDNFYVSKCIYIAGCLDIADPAIKSCF